MQPKTRQKIRKALRGGLRVDDTTDPQFADEFHANLTETFARQGIGPTYGVERVRQLIESLRGTPALTPAPRALARGEGTGRGDLWSVVVESPCPGVSPWIDPTTS